MAAEKARARGGLCFDRKGVLLMSVCVCVMGRGPVVVWGRGASSSHVAEPRSLFGHPVLCVLCTTLCDRSVSLKTPTASS
jgi:hypothetical protein